MEFVHRPYDPTATIAAVATPPGEGGIAVIRICGPQACEIADRVFSGPILSYRSHTAHFGQFLDENNEVIDEGLALVMLSPRSYTGENTIEFHCHGGRLITRKVLETVLCAGARTAEPGEFTFRAFMNGKLDLAQAEAVQALISAKNELALSAAEGQLQGTLSKKISHFQKELVHTAAILEAWVDFPEEGLEFASQEEIIAQLSTILEQMQNLEKTFEQGRVLQHGISLCLAGAPNAGKSSLMNALLRHDRAIVTDIPGTTRDLLEEDLRLGSLHFRLTDTAGIRETEETIEQEGIRRTKRAMTQADLVLFVADAQTSTTEYLDLAAPSKTILIWNKIDLPHPPLPEISSCRSVKLSAKEGWGIDELAQTIQEMMFCNGVPSKEEVTITNVRHQEALLSAIASLIDLIQGLKMGVSPEFLTSDMRACLQELGTIIGTNITEDILTAIFSKFCVGK